MKNILLRMLEPIIKQLIEERLPVLINDLDPSKSYLLIVPDSFPPAEVDSLQEFLSDHPSLLIVQADHVKLLELN